MTTLVELTAGWNRLVEPNEDFLLSLYQGQKVLVATTSGVAPTITGGHVLAAGTNEALSRSVIGPNTVVWARPVSGSTKTVVAVTKWPIT